MPADIILEVGFDTRRAMRDMDMVMRRAQTNFNRFTGGRGLPLGSAVHPDQFGKSLEAATSRVAAFGVAAGAIFAARRAFEGLISSTIKVEKSLQDINIVLNASTKNLSKFGSDLFRVAKDTGQSFEVAAAAAKEFSRQGLGLEETLKRTRDALILVRLTDLEVENSVNALTASINAFNKEALSSTDIINRLSQVDQAFAVSSKDLVQAIQKVGASAQDTGVSLNQLLAIVTAVRQRTGESGQILGNAFKTIFSRLQRPGTREQLRQFGIDVSGSSIDILQSMATAFKSRGLTQNQQNKVLELGAGLFQINRLRSAINDLTQDFSFYQRALDIANKSTDAAIQKNERLNETISAKLNRTLQNFIQLSSQIGQVGAGGGAGILDIANAGLEQATTGKFSGAITGGIGNLLFGPGAVAALTILGTLVLKIGKDIKSIVTSSFNITTETTKQAELEARISAILSSRDDLIKGLITGSKTLLSVEREILATLEAQNLVKKTTQAVTPMIASSLKNLAESTGPSRIGGRFSPSSMAIPYQQLLGQLNVSTPFTRQLPAVLNEQIRQDVIREVGRVAQGLRIGTVSQSDIGGHVNRIFNQFGLTSASGPGGIGPGISNILRGVNALDPNNILNINRLMEQIQKEAAAGGKNLRDFNNSLRVVSQHAGVSKDQWREIVMMNASNIRVGRSQFNDDQAKRAKAEAQRLATRQSRIQAGIFGVGMAAPFVTSQLQSMVDTSSKSGRISHSALGGIGQAASFTALGNMISPGIGTAAGATAGSLFGLLGVLRQMSTDLPEFTNRAELARESLSNTTDQLTQFTENIETLRDYMTGKISLPPERAANLRAQVFGGIANVPLGFRSGVRDVSRNFLSGGASREQLLGELNKFQFAEQNKDIANTLAQNLVALSEGKVKDREQAIQSIVNSLSLITGPTGQSIGATLQQRPNLRNYFSRISEGVGVRIAEPDIYSRSQQAAVPRDVLEGFDKFLVAINQLGMSPEIQSIVSGGFEKMAEKAPRDLALVVQALRSLFDTTAALEEGTKQVLGPHLSIEDVLSRISRQRTIAGIRNRLGQISLGGITRGIQTQTSISGLRSQGVLAQAELLAAPGDISSGRLSSFQLEQQRLQQTFEIQQRARERREVEKSGIAERLRGLVDTVSAENLESTVALEIEKINKSISQTADAIIGGGGIEDINQLFSEIQNKDFSGVTESTDRINIQMDKLTDNINGLGLELNKTFQDIEDEMKKSNAIVEEDFKIRKLIADLERRKNQIIIEQFHRGKRFRSDFISARQAQREDAILEGNFRPSMGFESFTDQLRYSTQDLYRDLTLGAADVGQAMKDSFADAFKSFVDGTRSAEDALRDFGLNILNRILDRSIDMAFNSLTGGIMAGVGALGRGVSGFFSGAQGANRGGLIGYAGGGMVMGGSGIRDDIPMNLSRGSFVIQKSAVNKLGSGFLASLNRGGRVGFANGGRVSLSLANRFDYDDPTHPTSGSRMIDPNLSNFALSDENSIKNTIRMERETALHQYLREAEAYEIAKINALKNYKNAKKQKRIGAYISAASSLVGAGLGSINWGGGSRSITGATGNTVTESSFTNVGVSYGNNASIGGGTSVYNPNSFRSGSSFNYGSVGFGRAKGGLIDTVPAMLTGGEFVMSPQAVRTHGVGFMNSLNRGQVPGFARGGVVGNSVSTPSMMETNDSLNNLVREMIILNQNLSKNTNGNRTNPTDQPSGIVIHNNIEIKMDNNGNFQGKNQTTARNNSQENTENANNEEERGRRLGETLNASIIAVLNRESKNGGLLDELIRRKG